ncbi:response regulator receiver protein [Vibrio ichthyoenteri ATCC 700023]|uniref:histidine kinase n=1 Tax=Vibrio ichthyoenteri ATCC 700023 TaxID=870968 RepID=F9S8U5_9VIBR|nr:response regulator [Vibrio ichthyoenteri]EGU29582.1 response regulator receiver protein [Vibrio ichthyoenteri ATCC 700023]
MDSFKRIAYDSPYKGMSVLIVDDFEAITRTLCNAFEQLGFKTIYQARDGREAWQSLERNSVDIIVSDWKMPKMDGLELLKKVRESKHHQKTPFIMLTGNLNQSDVVQAIEAGVSEYLVKPFSKVTLSERVHKAFVSPIRSHASRRSNDSEIQLDAEVKRTILVVDDEPSNLQVLGELLKPIYKIKACRSGAQAIDICAKADKPDLILLDIMMPEMDGLEVCKALKSDPVTEFIPIIFVSALSQTDDVVKGLKLGALDYIMKPVIPEIVLARVETHINAVIQREKLIKQVDQLIESSRDQDQADQTFFHDLRNPLTAIQTTLSQLKSDDNDVQVVKDNTAMLAQMIDNYRLLKQLERGEYSKPLTSVTAQSAIQQVVENYQAKAEQKQLRFSVDVDPALRYLGDELLSYTMLCNLFSNAIEAAPKESAITIQASPIEQQILMTIHNDGEVPEEIRPQFFDKFTTSGKSGGSGIGAYSAKLCAQAQQGEIKLEDAGEGTTISLHMQAKE